MRLHTLCLILIFLAACNSRPDPEEAGEWLTSVSHWTLTEVIVDGKPIYQEGKTIEYFGTIQFSRFMDDVVFLSDGSFRGRFKHDTKEIVLNWHAEELGVSVGDSVPNSGKWLIPYASLTPDSFDMITETAAINPPNITRIRLKFKQKREG